MIEEKAPYQIISDLVQVRRQWTDEQILTELSTLQPLPDEFADNEEGFKPNSEWDTKETYLRAFNLAHLYVAHIDIAVVRQLEHSIPLLLDRACYGDVSELLRGMEKSFYYIANHDLSKVAKYCIEAYNSPREGTRMWAIRTLFLMRQDDIPGVRETLNLAAQDSDMWIRNSA